MSSILPAIHRACFNDIIFEGRNKQYGAYELRLIYPSHLKRAIAAMLVLCAGLAAAPLVARYLAVAEPLVAKKPTDRPLDPHVLTPPPTLEHLPPPVQVAPVKPAVEVHTTRFVPPKVVTDVKPEENQTPMARANAALNLGAQNHAGEEVVAPPAEPVVPAPIGGGTTDEVFINVEVMPEYPGGNAELLRYVARHIKYPPLALRNGIEGRVFIKFVVDETGQLVNPVVQKGIGGGCDEEALRVLRTLPRFTPGQQNGRPVKVYFNLPISFKLGQ